MFQLDLTCDWSRLKMLWFLQLAWACGALAVGTTDSPASTLHSNTHAHIFPSVFNIGGVFSSPEHGGTLLHAIHVKNTAEPRRLPEGVQLNGTFIMMDSNPIRAAKSICEELIPRQVYVVIASRAVLPSDLSPMAVSFTCGFYKIPIIGLSARESSFSDKVQSLNDSEYLCSTR